MAPLTVVVDAANVMGSRPDGWWRDRAGAARRLVADAAAIARIGIPDDKLPDALERASLGHWWPQVVVVVEGAARPVALEASTVTVVAAPGSGDDEIVAPAEHARLEAAPGLGITADRELRSRCTRAGAAVVGPRWWLQRGPVA
jgi:8-oxo-dGTP diphosphatase